MALLTTPKLADAVLREALDAVKRYGTVTAAALALDINRSTLNHRLRTARQRFGISASEEQPAAEVELPTFPDDDIDVEEMLDHLERRFDKKQARSTAERWFPITIKSDSTVGLAVVGDPHLGVHSNIKLLRRDAAILAGTPGMMAVNIGDSADNWGRLVHLYAEADISRPTEQRLARWLLAEAGIPWVAFLLGNHDTMHSEFATYLQTINVAQIPMVDWRARFRLVFPACEVRVDAAHHHKGTSLYNRLHGQKRAALWDEDADIYVAGHHHTWAIAHEELDDGRVVHLARARGYKWHDEFATRHGFHEDKFGSTILFVIDPSEGDPVRRITAFADLAEGAEFLTWKRAR